MTELVWDGKYDKDGKRVAPVRIALPFQTVETVNESGAVRAHQLDLFAQGQPTDWRNRLIWGDKKYVLPSLLPEFAGKVNLIYIDPPFATGADFSFTATVPEIDESFIKEPNMIETKAYRDTWGRGLDSYLQWFYETAVLLRDLLAEDGSIYMHCDWRVSSSAKHVMDEVFGTDNFRNEIIWKRDAAGKGAKTISRQWPRIYDSILFFTKSDAYPFTQQFSELTDLQIKEYHYQDPDGRRFKRTSLGDYTEKSIADLEAKGLIYVSSSGQKYRKYYLDEGKVTVDSIWADIFGFGVITSSKEIVGYPTQKPEALLDRIIRASSNPGDLVLDCFCGSGTTAAVAEKLGRRWITCDLGRFAIHTARKRLLSIPNVRPFAVQNLGKYERQVWQTAEFANGNKTQQAAVQLAYRRFMLALYRAQPLDGYTWLHGLRDGRLVHVGSVDAPVAVGDIRQIIQEFWKVRAAAPIPAYVGGTGDTTPATPGLAAGLQPATSPTDPSAPVANPNPPPLSLPPLASAAAVGALPAAPASVAPTVRSNGVDILGWDFAFEINEVASQMAAEASVNLKFKRVPREVLEKKAVEQGDIKFFELAALSTHISQRAGDTFSAPTQEQGRNVTVTLTDFVVPPDDIPEDIQRAVTNWSQWIDYWAVDWDYKGDAFHNMAQTYRTRKDPNQLQTSLAHTYADPGDYTIVVKVIDILGNDTTKTLKVEVR